MRGKPAADGERKPDLVFSVEERERVRARLLARGQGDPRVVAGAVIGAGADGKGDRWSDIDLTFGLRAGRGVAEVLADWTGDLDAELGAAVLFDLPFGSTTYRVFLLPSNLQVDLSFTPAAEFGALGPRFQLVFGETVDREAIRPQPAGDVFGIAVHHAVRARICIERGRLWQAEYWISAVRDHALELACLHRGLEPAHGRGFDQLPADLLSAVTPALVPAIGRAELLASLACALRTLLAQARESPEVAPLASRLGSQLEELLEPSLEG